MIKTSLLFALIGVLAFSLNVNAASLRTNDVPFDCSILKPYCTCTNDSRVVCFEFTSFKQLNFSAGLNVSAIQFSPRLKLVLNDDLNLQGLSFWSDSTIYFSNIDSFDFESTVFANLNKNYLRLSISSSNFEFVYQRKSLEDPQVCESVLRNNSVESMFKKFDEFILSNMVIYKPICPVIFKNVHFTRIDSMDQYNQNYLVFLPVPEDVQFNAMVQYLYITGPQAKLNSSILNPSVFQSLTNMYIYGSNLSSIADDSFDNLPKLKRLNIQLDNFEQFFASSKNNWLINLNKEITIDLKNTSGLDPNFVFENAFTLSMDVRFINYTFPDDSFCYFRNFPHEHLVFPSIFPKSTILDCSCTLAYLYQYVYQIEPNYFPSFMYYCQDNFTEVVTQCNFPQRIKECDEATTTTIATTTTLAPFDCTILKPYCTCTNDSKVQCEEFTSFKQLNFSAGLKVQSITFASRQKLVLNDDLNLQGLSFWNDSSIYFSNIDSIDFGSTVFANLNKNYLRLSLIGSTLRFNYKGESLEDPEVCKSVLNDPNVDSMFKKFDEFILNIGISFPNALCPVIFRNTNLKRIDAMSQSDQNNLVFLPVPSGSQFTSSVENLFITGPQVKLNSSILDPTIFATTNTIDVYGTNLSTIADDSFDNLPKLKKLKIQLDNFEPFLQSTKNNWLINLNKGITIDLKNTSGLDPIFVTQNMFTLNMDVRSVNYKFPDSGLCYFKNFPHEHLVFPSIAVQQQRLNCSCTLAYLYQYVYQILPISFPSFMQACKANFTELVTQCNFTERFKMCEEITTTTLAPLTTTTTSSAHSHFKFSLINLFIAWICIQSYFSA